MARYLRHQDEVKVVIDEDGDMMITQADMHGEDKILINYANIETFIDILQNAYQDGYVKEEEDGLV